jgi:ABC-2 type transport system ATP-binding protein
VGYLYLSRLLAVGTPEELKALPHVAPTGTRRVEITGLNSSALLARLKTFPGVREATIFGQAVRALVDENCSLSQLGQGTTVRPAEVNLEDVFVTLARREGNRVQGSGSSAQEDGGTAIHNPEPAH